MSAESIRFAQIVLNRRNDLGLTQDDVTARGGPSDTTLSNIEAGTWSGGSPSTFKKLDRALGWTDGSARLTFNGGEPAVASTQEMPAGSGFRYPVTDPHVSDDDALRAAWNFMAELNHRLARVEQQLQERGEHRGNTAPTNPAGGSPANVSKFPAKEQAPPVPDDVAADTDYDPPLPFDSQVDPWGDT